MCRHPEPIAWQYNTDQVRSVMNVQKLHPYYRTDILSNILFPLRQNLNAHLRYPDFKNQSLSDKLLLTVDKA